LKSLDLKCFWKLEGPLHAGTGLSRRGYADRLIRRDFNDRPFIPGDAVKGAIRMSAERLLRWLVRDARPELSDKSLPTHPVMERIFRPTDTGVFYHFGPARFRSEDEPRDSFLISTTALDAGTRIARDETLRTIEASSRSDEFEVVITAEGGDWSPQSQDLRDGQFLAAALLATDCIGGKRGTGYGRLVVLDPSSSAAGISFSDLEKTEIVEGIKKYLESENQKVNL
jgi:CRISPR/Cas system CSM-associated protein Csm3 (group 7 of RAMP superfamily)